MSALPPAEVLKNLRDELDRTFFHVGSCHCPECESWRYNSTKRAEQVKALDAAISAVQAQQWQPIETAPKDGTEILAFDEGATMIVSWFDNYDENAERRESGWWDHCIMNPPPTHWMPLPASPA